MQHIQLASTALKKPCRQFEFTEQAKRHQMSTSKRILRGLPAELRPRDFDADEIIPGKLWLGSIGAAVDSEKLCAKRIQYLFTVADFCVLMEPASGSGARKWGSIIDHAVLDVGDYPEVNISHAFEEGIEWMDRAMKRGRVLVHCVQGVSRSASFVLAYLISKRKMTLQDALDYVKERRPCCKPNYGFLAQLSKFEHKLKPAVTKANV